MPAETRDELIDRRIEEFRKSATEAIRLKVEWLKLHNFPVWVSRNGKIVDASKTEPAQKPPH